MHILKLDKPNSDNLEQLSDEALLALASNGDDAVGRIEAVSCLFRRYQHLIFGVCMKYLRDADDSYDVTMSIFERLTEKIQLQKIETLQAWLHTLTRHECINFLRKSVKNEEKRQFLADLEKNVENFMENEGFLRLIDEQKTKQRETHLKNALQALSHEQRVCIEAFYLGEKSYKEISQMLGIEVNIVKSNLQNGKRKLAQLLLRTK